LIFDGINFDDIGIGIIFDDIGIIFDDIGIIFDDIGIGTCSSSSSSSGTRRWV
jgi:hypothetical protein